MSTMISIDTESIKTLRNEFDTEINTMSASMLKINESVDQLHATWEGPNHDAYVANFQIGYEKMNEMKTALMKFIDILDAAEKKYSQCENKNLERVTQF